MLNKNSKKAFYLQISEAIESMIRSGYFSHGQKLPTLAEMKEIFNVSLKVAALAYEDLNKKGYIYSKRGKGYYVSFYNHLRIDLNMFHQLEADLVYDHHMKRQMILFEIVKATDYICSKLNIEKDERCYHIKQAYGKHNQNVLLQELFLPEQDFHGLDTKYHDHKTTPSLIMNGFRYNINQCLNKFFSSQAGTEENVFISLQKGEPSWRVETTYVSDDDQPIVFMNQYLSGEFVNMAVMIDVE